MAREFSEKIPMNKLCKWLSLPRSSYYYRPSNRRKGVCPSCNTTRIDGLIVPNEHVVDEIKRVLSEEFVCYGYQNVTAELKDMGFIINHKKVYRLMDENHLLLGKVIKTQGKREWVKFRKIKASKPMEYLCWDIKYIWIPSERKNYYLLSLMDIYTRRILDWIFQSSIRKIDLIKMINRIDLSYSLKGVTVRNDNGSQFIANKVRFYLKTLDANQEFTHIATPEENAYIEAFHSLFDREVIRRFELASFYDAKSKINAYMAFYNNIRRHGSLRRISPMKKWNDYFFPSSSDKPQTAKVLEEMSRGAVLQDTRFTIDIFGNTATFAYQKRNEMQLNNNSKNLNSFEKYV